MSAASKAWHQTPAGRAWMRTYRRNWMRQRRAQLYRLRDAKIARSKRASKRAALWNALELLAPRPFAGCWKDPAWVRVYKRVWTRLKSESAAWRKRRAETTRRSRLKPEVRARAREGTREWKAAHPARVRQEWAKYSAKHRFELRRAGRQYYARTKKRCYACGHAAKSGPGNGMQRILRTLPDGSGGWVEREVLWCGRC